MLDVWFEIVLTVYGALYLMVKVFELSLMIPEEDPPINEEVMRCIYS